tara:strand:+ start:343 stop:552 length:210 start_codon:yes stop_codon:yes gene_type:complete
MIITAIAWKRILNLISLLEYFLLNLPPLEKPPMPTIKIIKTIKQATITIIKRGLFRRFSGICFPQTNNS